MKERILRRQTRAQIVLGKMIPLLNSLKESSEGGCPGEFEFHIDGWTIKYTGHLAEKIKQLEANTKHNIEQSRCSNNFHD